ncbi:uncharacterized protein BJ212DRAFT_1282645 [Suillus subaureus]|uniref:Uncharacterized protein n=1 Tax=Suillus subaureus TaxID=48587 RepID=A0A9P7DZG5_9AGAM|nr:uncharacterized protein BJ212DRAFT_1282645 [Suillus subaureus]KAG1807041.1 hypothetical protein BJ212DRAFT_1282645 [Suillus subaureus]
MVLPLHNGGLIIEFNNELLAKWLQGTEGKTLLMEQLGPMTCIQKQTFPIVGQYLPINLPLSNVDLLHRIKKNNNLPDETTAFMHWIKPPQCQSNEQRKAFTMIHLRDAHMANSILQEGICITNEHITVHKDKKEPIHYAKCQKFGHIAHNCKTLVDTYATCGGSHHTTTCNAYQTECCINCKTQNHASWSCSCPIFKQCCEELDKKYPENRMPYFPMDMDWTLVI